MIRFRALGPVELVDARGSQLLSVLAQPKRLALLAYLALSDPPGYRRRDELTALFWPERSQATARTALRGALHHLRRSLGENVLPTRGDEVAVDPELFWSDVSGLRAAVRERRWLEAVDLYRGDLLEAFHIEGAPDFERWLDDTRRELRLQASRAALEGARGYQREGQEREAAEMALRAVSLAPYDEPLLRDAVPVLVEAGDSAGALKALGAFQDRIEQELEGQPSAATLQLLERLKAPDALEVAVGSPEDPGGGALAPSPFETTPSTAAADPPLQDGQGGPRLRRAESVLVAGLVVVAGLFVAKLAGGGGPPLSVGAGEGDRPSVAVLPFEAIGRADADVALADEMHDELIHRLSQVGGLRVTSRTSVMGIRDHFDLSTDIARALGVRYLVEASIRRAGGEARVRVGLVDARTGASRWSRVFTRPFTIENEFAIQTDIATAIATELAVELTPAERARLADRPTSDSAALEAYRRGNVLFADRFLRQHRRRAAAAYREAKEYDPAFADAWARLARVRVLDFWFFGAYDAAREAYAALERAEALDSARAEVHLARGDVLYYTLRDYRRARRHYERVLQLRPNDAVAMAQIGLMSWRSGNVDDAIALLERSLELDPRSPGYNRQIAQIESERRRADRARHWIERALELDPDNDDHRFTAVRIALCVRGDTVAARRFVEATDWATGEVEARARAALAVFRGEIRRARDLAPPIPPGNDPYQGMFALHTSPPTTDREKAFALHALGERRALRSWADSVLDAPPDTLDTADLLRRPYRQTSPGWLWSQRGLFEAFRGNAAAAVRWARRGATVMSPEEDWVEHALRRRDLMDTYVLVGQLEAALEELEFLLARPSGVGIGCLRLHPFYAPLRAHPRFEEVVAGA